MCVSPDCGSWLVRASICNTGYRESDCGRPQLTVIIIIVLTLIRNADCLALRIIFLVPKVISCFVKVISRSVKIPSSYVEVVRVVAKMVAVLLRVIEKRRGSTCCLWCFLFVDMDGVIGCL